MSETTLRRRSGFSYRWQLLAMLCLAFFFNQGDRQLFGVVLTSVRGDLGLTDTELGLIASVLFWTLGLLFPIAGYVGDRWSKKWTITGALAFWSTATVCTGFCRNAWQLVALRSVATGGGEAFYAPSAYALIAQFHRRTRALAVSLHQTVMYAGFVASGLVGGYLSQTYSWRSAFYVFGAGGILLAVVLAIWLKDSDSDAEEPLPSGAVPPSFRELLRTVFGTPSAVLMMLAHAGMLFMHLAYLTWGPAYFREKFAMTEARAGFASMFYFQVFALVGILAASVLSDRWARRRRSIRIEMLGFGLIASVPFICLLGLSTTPTWGAIALAGFGLCRAPYDANSYAALFDVIRPRFRASANAFMSTTGFILAAGAPYVMGLLKSSIGLSGAFLVFSLAHVAATLAVLVARVSFYRADANAADAA